jgi:hypothetical protein
MKKRHDIFSIYALLCDFDLCKSERVFSVELLGRSHTYFAYLKSSKNYPYVEALVFLSVRLKDASASLVYGRSADLRSRAAVLHDAGAAILILACQQAMAVSRRHVIRSNCTPPAKFDARKP